MAYRLVIDGETNTQRLVEIPTAEYAQMLLDAKAIDDAEKSPERIEVKKADEVSTLDKEGVASMRKAIAALAAGQALPKEYIDYEAKVSAIEAKYEQPQAAEQEIKK